MEETTKGGVMATIVSALESLLTLGGKVKLRAIVVTFVIALLFIIAVLLYRIASSDDVIEALAHKIEYVNKFEHEKLLARQKVTPQINYELEKLLFQTNADRTFIIELHNGKENATYLPFLYYDMTYEEVNRRTKTERIAQNFQNVNISTFKLPYYLERHLMFMGDSAAINAIDIDFGGNFTKYGGQYGAFMFLKSGGKEIGFLGIAYNSMKNVDEEEIREALIEYSQTIAPLLDLEKQVSIENNITKEDDKP